MLSTPRSTSSTVNLMWSNHLEALLHVRAQRCLALHGAERPAPVLRDRLLWSHANGEDNAVPDVGRRRSSDRDESSRACLSNLMSVSLWPLLLAHGITLVRSYTTR